MGKTVAVANQKGGVGKTTTTVNLAAFLADMNQKILVVDMDAQANASSGMNIARSETNSIYNMLVDDLPPQACIVRSGFANLDVLPSHSNLSGAEVEILPIKGREFLLKKKLEEVKSGYNYIFIDCPPSLGMLTLNALVAADTVVIPLQCEYYALEGTSQLINSIRLIKKRLNQSLDIEGVVMTMYDHRTNLSTMVMEEARKVFRDRVYKTYIPRNIKLAEAPSHGLPINRYDQNSAGGTAYKRLAREFLRWNEEE